MNNYKRQIKMIQALAEKIYVQSEGKVGVKDCFQKAETFVIMSKEYYEQRRDDEDEYWNTMA